MKKRRKYENRRKDKIKAGKEKREKGETDEEERSHCRERGRGRVQ